MKTRPALAVIAAIAAVAPVVVSCQGTQGGTQVPASFSPSPCPSGQHLGPLDGPGGPGCLDGASHPEYGGQS